VPQTRETPTRQAYRSGKPAGVLDLSSILTPSVAPYDRSDTTNAAVGFDRSWLVVGEDGQHHVISKEDFSTYRADREPDWTAASPWNVQMVSKVSGYVNGTDSPNAFMRATAAETWTYADPGISVNVTTGYAVSVGSGDLLSGAYRPPFVTFWREGAPAAQSLTSMLDTAGIMGGDYTSPRCLMDVARVAADTFYLSGAGGNQSTNPVTSRPTFGRMVLTLTGGTKTQTGITGVSSLTWTDYLPTLQAAMPAGETIINVPAIADKLSGTTLFVMVVTQDGSAVLRARLVLFDNTAHTAALDALLNASSGAAIWPITPYASTVIQAATITVGTSGILFLIVGASLTFCFYRATAETTWRSVINQANRAIGTTGVNGAMWDAARSRFVITGSTGAGWLDASAKQGHPYTDVLPINKRWPTDGVRTTLPGCADAAGTLVVGARQLAVLIPTVGVTNPTRVLWGLRVIPTGNINEVAISEGEALIYNGTRVYFAGGTVAGLSTATYPYTIVLTAAAAVSRPGNSFACGADYPEPALYNQAILANVTPTVTNAIRLTAEITATYRDN